MDSDVGKLFIGGISWETTEDKMKDYFSNYGEVSESVIMKDRATGRARGFGFVVFADPAVADRVVLEKHTIDGRTVEAKKAVPRDEQQNLPRSVGGGPAPTGTIRTKKIFVGGLASTVNEEVFKEYFEQFGTITDVVVMYDHATQRPRGFGFITFDAEDAVDSVLQRSFHELNGKLVEVKRAIPKELQGPPWARSPGAAFGGAVPRGSPFAAGYATSAGSYGGRYGTGPVGRAGYPTYGGTGYGPVGYAGGSSYRSGMNGSYGGAAESSYGGSSYGGTPGGGYAAGYGPMGSVGSGSYGSALGRSTWGIGGYGSLGSSAGYSSTGSGYGSDYGGVGGWNTASGSAGGYGGAGYGYGGSESGYSSAAGSYGGRGTGYASGTGTYGGQSGATGHGTYGASYVDGYATSGYQDSTWRSESAESYGTALGGAGLGSAAGVGAADISSAGYGDYGRRGRGPDARFKSYTDHTGY